MCLSGPYPWTTKIWVVIFSGILRERALLCAIWPSNWILDYIWSALSFACVINNVSIFCLLVFRLWWIEYVWFLNSKIKNTFPLSSLSTAVILPTIWRFLQTLDAAPYFLGLVLSAFSLSGLLSGPLFGHWSDRTRSTKKIILFANIFEIVGESTGLAYFLTLSNPSNRIHVWTPVILGTSFVQETKHIFFIQILWQLFKSIPYLLFIFFYR